MMRNQERITLKWDDATHTLVAFHGDARKTINRDPRGLFAQIDGVGFVRPRAIPQRISQHLLDDSSLPGIGWLTKGFALTFNRAQIPHYAQGAV